MDGGTEDFEYKRAPASWTWTGTPTTASGTWTRGNVTTMSGMLAIRCSPPKLLCFSRYFFGGSFVSSPFFQPPSCLPISPNIWDSSACWSVEISLFSQASWIKNLRISSLDIVLMSSSIFCSGGKYTDAKVTSRRDRKVFSIFCPIPKCSTLGKSRCNLCHKL